MLELHHAPISTCSQKVRLVLAEKGLTFEGHELNLQAGEQFDPAYRKLNPAAVVPTLVHDGAVLVESSLINEYLDDAFPEPPLRPRGAAARHAMRLLVKRLDDGVHAACGVLTYAIGVRPMLLRRPREEVLATVEKIPSAARRAARRSVIEHGVEAPEIEGATRAHVALLGEMEDALGRGPWLAGDAFSLADAALLPYVLRLDHLGLGGLFADRPRVGDWFARAQARPSFETAVAAFAPEPVVGAMRRAGESAWPAIERIARGKGALRGGVEGEVAALERAFMEAVRRRDMAWLEDALGPEFALTTGRPGFEVRGRQEWLDVTRERYAIESFAFDALEVLVYEPAAVVRSRYRQRARMGDQDRTGTYLMTDVWVRRDGRFRLVTRHLSPIAG